MNIYKEILQPFPYQTNCFNYEKSFDSRNLNKSQVDCTVKFMQQKELEVCGCNRKWFIVKSKVSIKQYFVEIIHVILNLREKN